MGDALPLYISTVFFYLLFMHCLSPGILITLLYFNFTLFYIYTALASAAPAHSVRAHVMHPNEMHAHYVHAYAQHSGFYV